MGPALLLNLLDLEFRLSLLHRFLRLGLGYPLRLTIPLNLRDRSNLRRRLDHSRLLILLDLLIPCPRLDLGVRLVRWSL